MSGKKRNVMLFVLLFTLLLGVIVPVQAQSYGGTKIIRVAYREVNNPVPVSLLSGDRKPQIRFLGNHHSGSGNLYHKSFRM